MFNVGDLVMTPDGAGVVQYRLMAAPYYNTVQSYSVKLDCRTHIGYRGTMYTALAVVEIKKED